MTRDSKPLFNFPGYWSRLLRTRNHESGAVNLGLLPKNRSTCYESLRAKMTTRTHPPPSSSLFLPLIETSILLSLECKDQGAVHRARVETVWPCFARLLGSRDLFLWRPRGKTDGKRYLQLIPATGIEALSGRQERTLLR